MKIKNCICGRTPRLVKLFPAKRYDCFIECDCGKETRVYTSKQNAVKAWNAGIIESSYRNNTKHIIGDEQA